MPASASKFLQELAQLELVDPDQLTDIDSSLSAREVAQALVKAGTLSPWQARRAYSGKAESLRLGRYVLIDKLGEGGMGLVLKARHRRMDRLVAIKVLSPRLVGKPELLSRFQREVRAAARLEHRNIVTAYDADEVDGRHFLVMQYVDGCDLQSLVSKRGPLNVGRAVDFIVQAGMGLAYAHNAGVVHRDVKPANMLLDGDGVVRILDMGLARLGDSQSEAERQLTEAGAIMGTVDYMAPEQATDTHSADARADIYSLGASLYFLLTGKPLFGTGSVSARLLSHQRDPVPALPTRIVESAPGLEAICRKMLAKDPDERYQTMADVLNAIEAHGVANPTADETVMLPGQSVELLDFCRSLDPTQRTRTSETDSVSNALEPTVVLPTNAVKRERPRSVVPVQLVVAGAVGVLLIFGFLASGWGSSNGGIDSGQTGSDQPSTDVASTSSNERDQAVSRATAGSKSADAEWEHRRTVIREVLALGGVVVVDGERPVVADTVPVDQRAANEVPVSQVDMPVIYVKFSSADPRVGNPLVTDEVVERLMCFAELRLLYLHHTAITGETYKKLGRFKELTNLDVRGSYCDASALRAIGYSALQNLSVGDTKVGDDGIRVIVDQFPKLTRFTGFSCDITDASAEYLAELPDLKRVDVAGTSITDNFVERLARSTKNLVSLTFTGTAISDAGVGFLTDQQHLESLHLGRTRVTDDGVRDLCGLPSLTLLHVYDTSVTKSGILELQQQLRRCKVRVVNSIGRGYRDELINELLSAGARIWLADGLEVVADRVESRDQVRLAETDQEVDVVRFGTTEVFQAHSKVTDEVVAAISKFPAVTTMELRHTSIGEAAYTSIGKMRLLSELCVADSFCTAAALRKVGAMPGLESFEAANSGLGDEGLRVVANQFTGLTFLSVPACSLSDECADALTDLKKLQRLVAYDNPIGDEFLRAASQLSELRELSVSGTEVTDEGLKHLARLSGLKHLNLRATNLSDEAIEHLAVLNGLTTLNVSNTRISADGIAALRQRIPNCELIVQ